MSPLDKIVPDQENDVGEEDRHCLGPRRFAFANLDVLKRGGKSRDDRGEIGVNNVAYTYVNGGDAAGDACWFALADPRGARYELKARLLSLRLTSALGGKLPLTTTLNPRSLC